jgi:hypothetical protein
MKRACEDKGAALAGNALASNELPSARDAEDKSDNKAPARGKIASPGKTAFLNLHIRGESREGRLEGVGWDKEEVLHAGWKERRRVLKILGSRRA